MKHNLSGDKPKRDVPSPRSRIPGPHIIPIDYDALCKMEEPPKYKPFDVYGWFLLSVATQQTPMVINHLDAHSRTRNENQ